MDLKDTIELMNSSDCKDQLKAEYLQTRIRYNLLNKILVKLEAGTLETPPVCSRSVLMERRRYMSEYLRTLEIEAELAGVEFES